MRMDSRELMQLFAGGYLPDVIQQKTGLTPGKQQKILKQAVKDKLKKASDLIDNKPSWYPWGIDAEGYTRALKVATKHWAWIEIRLRKRKYDRMNKAAKAANKDRLAREIDWLLELHRTGIWDRQSRPFG